MNALELKISSEGIVLSDDVLKVGSFLNQRIDTAFMFKIGEEISSLYLHDNVTKILTIEASGIAVAVAAAHYLSVPVVFAKKASTSNISGDVYTSKIHSFTHGCDYEALVPVEFLQPQDRVLIVDDFLADGNALSGLADIVSQSGATVVGAAVAIEKGFQGGGDRLRALGMRIESLAIVDAMGENGITFRNKTGESI